MSNATPPLPHRWDLVRPDRLGSLLDDVDAPGLGWLDELTECGARVLARSGNGDLCFVGRSADNLFDLLSGALAGTSWQERPVRLPLSCTVPPGELSARERRRLREHLAAVGLEPRALARRSRPVTLVDLVWAGRTFTTLHTVLRGWVDETREPWPVVRLKLRYLGVTSRERTSPKTYRWRQHRPWTRDLPAGSVSSISIHPWLWNVLGNAQAKTAPSFPPREWHQEGVTSPARRLDHRQALAQAVALVAVGRTPAVRDRMVRTMAAEPAVDQPWLRSLMHELRAAPGSQARRQA
ncbi:hypothetical protein [Streptacidiphilus sp. EB129]|uniref:hypothetical protein n=1 Tax=Streptacidiphilus sp. EB129 TaxID=3156262 RepID=UPI0035154596